MDDVVNEEKVGYTYKMKEPLISLVLPTKNALPHVKETIEALKKQTYRHFELIVQDGGSTDGTLEFLESIPDLPSVKIESKPDNGIGDAYGRGMERSQGDFLCFIASDERLLGNSLEIGMGWFKKFPNAAFIIGSVELINGKKRKIFKSKTYHFLRVMSCEYVLPISGILNRKVIGQDFYYDRTLKTCPDYDFWLRLGVRFSKDQLIVQPEVFMSSLADFSSMSYRVESVEQFCKDKCFILDRFLNQRPELEVHRNQSMEGIYRWASSTACEIDPESELCARFANKAEEWSQKDTSPPSDFHVIKSYVKKQHAKSLFNFKFFTKFVFALKRLASTFDSKVFSLLANFINKLSRGDIFIGEKSAWGNMMYYSIEQPSSNWVKISLEIYYGAVSICFMKGSELIRQKVFYKHPQKIETYFTLSGTGVNYIVFRNGGVPHSSFRINELSIIEAK